MTKYTVVIKKEEDGTLFSEVPELPGCYSQGRDKKELLGNTREAIELYLETMRDMRKKPAQVEITQIEV